MEQEINYCHCNNFTDTKSKQNDSSYSSVELLNTHAQDVQNGNVALEVAAANTSSVYNDNQNSNNNNDKENSTPTSPTLKANSDNSNNNGQLPHTLVHSENNNNVPLQINHRINFETLDANGLIRLDMSQIIDRTGLPTYEAALKLQSSGYV